MTAVITDSLLSFNNWCKERNIKRLGINKWEDCDGESYMPIINESHIRGQYFLDFEIVPFVYIKDLVDLKDLIKTRLKKQ